MKSALWQEIEADLISSALADFIQTERGFHRVKHDFIKNCENSNSYANMHGFADTADERLAKAIPQTAVQNPYSPANKKA